MSLFGQATPSSFLEVRMRICACVYLLLSLVMPLSAQDSARTQSATPEADAASATVAQSPADSSDDMVTPTPVGDVGLPLSVAVETERKNYIRGGVSFQT